MKYDVHIIRKGTATSFGEAIATYLNYGYEIKGISEDSQHHTAVMVKEIHEPVQEQTSETVR